MLLPEVKNSLREAIGDLGEGFVHGRPYYTKKGRPLNQFFSARTLKWTGGWASVDTEVFLGWPQVNRVYSTITGHQLPPQGVTCGFGVWNEDRSRGHYTVESDNDIEPVAAQVKKDFQEVAIPFFEAHRTIEEVAHYLNRRSANGRYWPLSVPASCWGLIAAHLIGDPEIETMYRDYDELCTAGQGKVLAQPVTTVMEYLRRNKIAVEKGR